MISSPALIIADESCSDVMTAEDRQVLVSSEEEEEEDVLEEDIFQSPVYIRPDAQSPSLVYVASASAALGGLIFGYDVGVIAGARTLVARDLGLLCTQEELHTRTPGPGLDTLADIIRVELVTHSPLTFLPCSSRPHTEQE